MIYSESNPKNKLRYQRNINYYMTSAPDYTPQLNAIIANTSPNNNKALEATQLGVLAEMQGVKLNTDSLANILANGTDVLNKLEATRGLTADSKTLLADLKAEFQTANDKLLSLPNIETVLANIKADSTSLPLMLAQITTSNNLLNDLKTNTAIISNVFASLTTLNAETATQTAKIQQIVSSTAQSVTNLQNIDANTSQTLSYTVALLNSVQTLALDYKTLLDNCEIDVTGGITAYDVISNYGSNPFDRVLGFSFKNEDVNLLEVKGYSGRTATYEQGQGGEFSQEMLENMMLDSLYFSGSPKVKFISIIKQ